MPLPSDTRLAERVRRGDDKAFERLYARHQPAILSFCRHLTGNREDAEDAVQHAFLSAYRRIFEAEGDLELRPWLFAVARNRCLSLLRARRGSAVGPHHAEGATDGLAVEVERREELRDLVTDLGRLPDQQRAALVLSQLEALSHREIGAILGVPSEKVKALVFQARSTLASTRAARAAPCTQIREEIATSRGSALRRRTLRRHVQQCDGCRTFEAAVLRQRHHLEILLPAAPSAGLAQVVLGRDVAVGGAGGAAATAAVSGGAGGGIAGSLASIGLPGAAKLAAVAVVAGGTAGAVAADLPERLRGGAARSVVAERAPMDIGSLDGGAGSAGPRNPHVDGRSEDAAADTGEEAGGRDRGPTSRARGQDDAGARPGIGDAHRGEPPAQGGEGGGGIDRGGGEEGGGESGLPPGLARKDELPPGLAEKDEQPPGLAKRDDAPGKAKGKAKGKAPANGGGHGQGGDGGPGQGGGQGQGNGNGGSHPAGGSGGENGNGGQGQGNGNGNGGQGNGNGQGHGAKGGPQ